MVIEAVAAVEVMEAEAPIAAVVEVAVVAVVTAIIAAEEVRERDELIKQKEKQTNVRSGTADFIHEI